MWIGDSLEYLVNTDSLTRQILGVHADKTYDVDAKEIIFFHQTIVDNVSFIDEKLLAQINTIVVAHGQKLFKKNCYLKTKFEQLAVRKSSKKALIAIARKQLVIVWNVLTKQEQYKEPQIKLSAEQISRKQKYYQGKLNQLQQQQILEKAE